MALRTPRLIAPLAIAGLGAMTLASCSQQPPTSPSALQTAAGVQAATEYWVTLYDETTPGEPGTPEEPNNTLDEGPPPPPGTPPAPWPPGPPPRALPGVPVPEPPSTHFRLTMKVDPEPVAHSGVPVPLFSCRDNRYTWYYDQHLISETGVPVTFTERENFFDGRFVGKNTEQIRLGGNGAPNKVAVLHTRWCSAIARPHYAQTRFKGVSDDGEVIVVNGPWVRMLMP
jgi:hypothetical protein